MHHFLRIVVEEVVLLVVWLGQEHLLVVEFEAEALEWHDVVLFIPRELLHNLLLLFDVVVEERGQVVLLNHHDHVQEVVRDLLIVLPVHV